MPKQTLDEQLVEFQLGMCQIRGNGFVVDFQNFGANKACRFSCPRADALKAAKHALVIAVRLIFGGLEVGIVTQSFR